MYAEGIVNHSIEVFVKYVLGDSSFGANTPVFNSSQTGQRGMHVHVCAVLKDMLLFTHLLSYVRAVAEPAVQAQAERCLITRHGHD